MQCINHGSSINRAGFLTTTDIFALSHDELFSIYELETDLDESPSDQPPKVFGDLRSRLNCEYIVDVAPSLLRNEGEAIVGAGSHRYSGLQSLPVVF